MSVSDRSRFRTQRLASYRTASDSELCAPSMQSRSKPMTRRAALYSEVKRSWSIPAPALVGATEADWLRVARRGGAAPAPATRPGGVVI